VPRRTNDDPVARAFGSALKQARAERDMTLEAVAGAIERTGRNGQPTVMDPKYLSSIERGWHSPTVTTAKQIANALDMPLAHLVRDL